MYRMPEIKTATIVTLLVQVLFGDAAHSNDFERAGASKRIYGGIQGNPRNAPYITYIRIETFWDKKSELDASNRKQWCTGSVISKYWVLTAAHCMHEPYLYNTHNPHRDSRWENVQVNIIGLVGMVDAFAESKTNVRKQFEVKTGDIFTHPNTMEYFGRDDIRGEYLVDVALLRINGGFPPNYGIGTVPLMSGKFPSNRQGECIGMGYGSVKNGENPMILNYHKVVVGDVSYCQKLYPGDPWKPYHLCAVGKVGHSRACGGDSGGPLLCGYPNRQVVVGILHGTFGDHLFCGPSSDDVHYISTGYIEQWIRDTTRASDLRFIPF